MAILCKPYGRTGKEISAVGFGGMRFANQDDIEANAEVVRHAYARGINYFDTAPGYGKSEDIFGAAFKQMDHDRFYVSTKTMAATGDDLRADLDKSLQRMGIDCVDFYHIWCIMSLEAWHKRRDGGAVAEALKAKNEGLVKHVVVSSHMEGQAMGQVLREGPFEGVTLGYCAVNFPYREQAVQTAGQLGIGVVTMNPLGGGVIPQNAERFDFLRGPDDPSVVAAAVRFNISHPAITCALVGFTTTDHVDEAVAAAEDFAPYDQAHLDKVRRQIVEGMDQLCTGCGYCLPCPADVPIPQMMDVYNMKMLGTSEREIWERMKWHWHVSADQAAACTDCGECEEKCTQHLPIRERLAFAASVVDEPPRK